MKRVVKWIFVCLLVVGVVATFAFLWMRQRPKPRQYEVLRVERRDMSSHTIVTGKVEPRDEVAIKAQLGGIIAELYKEPGEKVRVGEPIARIKVVPDLAQRSNAASRVRLAEYNLNNVHEVFQRDSALYTQKVIARETYESSRLKYINALEEYQAAQDNLSIVQEGVSASSGEKGNTIVRATIAGMVLDVPVKVGNTVINANNYNDGTTVATVADMSDMLFVGKIDETDVGKLHEGMKMDLIVGALNDKRFNATLEYISPKGTETNGAMMFEIKGAARIPDSVEIRSGYSANAEIILDSRTQVLTIDEAAVHITPDSTYVLLATDSTAQNVIPTLVTTGMSDGIYIEITSGLKEGDLVRGNAKGVDN